LLKVAQAYRNFNNLITAILFFNGNLSLFLSIYDLTKKTRKITQQIKMLISFKFPLGDLKGFGWRAL